MEYDLYKGKKDEVVITYPMAAKYLRRAFIYLTESLEILTANIDEVIYLRLAFMVHKIINSMQKDSMSGSIFW